MKLLLNQGPTPLREGIQFRQTAVPQAAVALRSSGRSPVQHLLLISSPETLLL